MQASALLPVDPPLLGDNVLASAPLPVASPLLGDNFLAYAPLPVASTASTTTVNAEMPAGGDIVAGGSFLDAMVEGDEVLTLSNFGSCI